MFVLVEIVVDPVPLKMVESAPLLGDPTLDPSMSEMEVRTSGGLTNVALLARERRR